MATLPRVSPEATWDKLRKGLRGLLAAAARPRTAAVRGGLGAVVRKEFADQIRSWRMGILVALLVVTAVASLYTAAMTIRETAGIAATPDFVFLRLFTGGSEQLPPLTSFLGFLAPLVGIALGFDAICGEHSRRTLSRVLAQPIHRDALINGKFLAGLMAVALMLVALLALVGSLGLVMIGVPPTGDELLRLIAFTGITLVYVAFWLALSILFSVLFRQAATSALAGIAVWLFFSVFWEMIVGLVAGSETAALWLSRLSPGTLYAEAVLTVLTPTVRTLGPVTIEQLIGALQGVLPFSQSLLLVWPQVVGLIAFTAAEFAAAYILFMRREIRA
ncbi:MAG: ABC transporter permease [Bacillota bacterium]